MSKKEYNYEYEEDRIVRATEANITLSGEIVTSKVVANTVKYYYDTDGKMTKKLITPAGGWTWSRESAGKTSPVISLTNHSNAAVKASFSFNSEVAGLNGSFSETELTLATAEGTEPAAAPKAETSFSLGGSGIDADKALGMITVTVTKSGAPLTTPTTPDDTPDEPEDPSAVPVSTAEEYKSAVEAGGTIKLTNDIECYETINFASDVVINLNGHTLNGCFVNFTRLTLKNGTVNVGDEAIRTGDGELTVENCTVNGGSGDRTISVDGFDSKVTFSGRVTLEYNDLGTVYGDVFCLAGTYNFDPEKYIDTAVLAVTDNHNGTWTVR